MLRPRHEAQGSQAAAVLRLTPARYILVNARVRTLDDAVPGGSAVAIGGGRVLALGALRTVAAHRSPATEWIDCDGATLLPGLIDPHLHLHALAAAVAHVDCRGFRRVARLLAAVRACAATQPVGTWIRGDGIDEQKLDRLPTAAELDSAAPRHLVRLRHRSLHASVVSGRVLARLGAAPAGDGLIVGQEEGLRRLIGPLPAAILRAGFREVGRTLVRCGLTTVADATPRPRARLAALAAAIDAGDLLVRVFAMRPPGTRPWRGRGRLQPGPVKIVVHEEGTGLRPSPAVLARLIERAATAGDAVAVHCLGAHALVATLAGFARLPARWRQGRGHRLEHVAECPPALVAEIARLGLAVVTNPAFIWDRGDVYRQETHPTAHAWLYRARSLVRAGVLLAAASDAPVVAPDPWRTIATARVRRTRRGHVLGARERLSAAAALRVCTRAAGDVLGAPSLGRLRVGGPADLIVVDRDPLRTPAAAILQSRVRLTIIGGEIVWRT